MKTDRIIGRSISILLREPTVPRTPPSIADTKGWRGSGCTRGAVENEVF